MADDLDNLNTFDLDFIDDDEIESDKFPDAKAITLKQKARTRRAYLKCVRRNEINQEQLHGIFPALPLPDESIHFVSSGNFSFYNFVPHIITMTGDIDEMHICTWTMNKYAVLDILKLLDSGIVGKASVLIGRYFNRKDPAVYALAVEGFRRRKQRILAFETHAKVTLLKNSTHSIVIEGSANLTDNPRLEQFVVTNNPELYEFHRTWMEEMLAKQVEE